MPVMVRRHTFGAVVARAEVGDVALASASGGTLAPPAVLAASEVLRIPRNPATWGRLALTHGLGAVGARGGGHVVRPESR